uniref:uncharacterized protein LOC122594508 n=1 Tax=Erigeron canadensis TaxID=72917 RepID=UPI001CB99518|nr:uncharacterized protein LOC122594508 [Erigeron canadensis]
MYDAYISLNFFPVTNRKKPFILRGGFSVIDVENSTAIEVASFKALKGNRLSIRLKALGEATWSVAVKRKFSDLSGSQIDPSQEDNTPNLLTNINKEAYLDDGDAEDYFDLIIVAYFKEDMALFLLPSSSLLADAMEKINEEFSLDQGTYTLKYESFEGRWPKLYNDRRFTICKEVWRQNLKDHIKLRVEKDH